MVLLPDFGMDVIRREGGAQAMVALNGRADVAFGANNGFKADAGCRGIEAAELAAYGFLRQMYGLVETGTGIGSGDDHHRCQC